MPLAVADLIPSTAGGRTKRLREFRKAKQEQIVRDLKDEQAKRKKKK